MVAEALVEQQQPLPADSALCSAPAPGTTWHSLVALGDFSETLLPSEFAKPSPALLDLAKLLDVRRRDDPLVLLRQLNASLITGLTMTPAARTSTHPSTRRSNPERGYARTLLTP